MVFGAIFNSYNLKSGKEIIFGGDANIAYLQSTYEIELSQSLFINNRIISTSLSVCMHFTDTGGVDAGLVCVFNLDGHNIKRLSRTKIN